MADVPEGGSLAQAATRVRPIVSDRQMDLLQLISAIKRSPVLPFRANRHCVLRLEANARKGKDGSKRVLLLGIFIVHTDSESHEILPNEKYQSTIDARSDGKHPFDPLSVSIALHRNS